MSTTPRAGRMVPIALGLAMLAVVVAAGLSPNTGAVTAQGNCSYGQCVASTGIQWWVFAAIVVVVIAALAAALVLLRRRRPPTKTGAAAVPPSAGPMAPAAGAGPAPPTPPAAAPPAYLEGPEDVGATLPSVPPAPVKSPPPAAGAAAGAGAAAEGEPDIDSLMAELDKISGEILKRPKTPDKKPPSDQ